jgi:hypothetical protein
MKKLILTLCIAILTMQLYALTTVGIQQVTNAVPGTGLTVAVNSDFSTVSGGVSAFQFDITFDASCLAFTGIQNSVFSGAEASSINSTTLRVIWTDYAAHNYLNGKMFDLVFNYKGGNSNVNFITANCTVTAFGAIPVATNYTNGFVHMVTPMAGVTIGTLVSQNGLQVNIPVTATQFYNIGGFSFYINLPNSGVISGGTMTLANVNAALSAGLTYGYSSGLLSITWTTTSSDNISFATGTKLFDLRFTFASGISAINFNTGTSGIYENAPPFNAFTGVTYTNGSISGPDINIKVFLEGPYAGGGLMNTTLKTNALIPPTQPYNVAPWSYTGTEHVANAAAIPAGVVDWVLVELRDAATAAEALPGTKLAGWPKALFLKSDGSIVDIDGTSLPNVGVAISQNLFVVVRHRNHIDIMSANGVTLTENTYNYDFSTAVTKAYNGAAGYKQIATGVFGMVAGDIDGDGNILGSDFMSWAISSGLTGIYSNSDQDFDGNILGSDFSKWATNSGTSNPITKSAILTTDINMESPRYSSQVPEEILKK